MAAHRHRRYAARVNVIHERAGRNAVVAPMEQIVPSELVRRQEKDAPFAMTGPAFPGRSTISAGAVASALAATGRAVTSCSAACQSADSKWPGKSSARRTETAV